MAYPPFKMRGHELPGPNQRQPDELLGPGSEVLAQDTQQNTVNEQPNN